MQLIELRSTLSSSKCLISTTKGSSRETPYFRRSSDASRGLEGPNPRQRAWETLCLTWSWTSKRQAGGSRRQRPRKGFRTSWSRGLSGQVSCKSEGSRDLQFWKMGFPLNYRFWKSETKKVLETPLRHRYLWRNPKLFQRTSRQRARSSSHSSPQLSPKKGRN